MDQLFSNSTKELVERLCDDSSLAPASSFADRHTVNNVLRWKDQRSGSKLNFSLDVVPNTLGGVNSTTAGPPPALRRNPWRPVSLDVSLAVIRSGLGPFDTGDLSRVDTMGAT